MRNDPSRKVLALTMFIAIIMVLSSAGFVFGNELDGHFELQSFYLCN